MLKNLVVRIALKRKKILIKWIFNMGIIKNTLLLYQIFIYAQGVLSCFFHIFVLFLYWI